MIMTSSSNLVDINPLVIYEFLKLVLLNNYFYFKHNNLYTFFLQTKGVAMGTSCGLVVANIYLAYFEIKYRIFLDISLYYRFINDLIYTDSFNS